MTRNKRPDTGWPDAWDNDAPAERGCGENRRYETVEDDETFHLGQIYENTAAKLLRCRGCGGTAFNVGQGDYITVIRCTACRWEESIHDG